MSFQDERPSPMLKLIAAKHEELAMLYTALADPDRDFEPETPEGEVVERPIKSGDIVSCMAAGEAARKACIAAGTAAMSCYAVGRIAEAACLKDILDEKERRTIVAPA